TSPEEFEEAFATRWAHDTLRRQLASVPQADAIVLVAADGRVLNSTRGWPVERINISDLPHFQFLRTHPDPAPYVSVPMTNRSTGTSAIYLSRRLTGRGGEFLGVVQAAVRIKYFEDLYKSATLTDGYGVTLLRNDGVVITRHPLPPNGLP